MKSEEDNEPDVVKIAKKLPVQEFEGYAVLDFLPDEAPATPIPPSNEQLELLRNLLRGLEQQYEEADALKCLLAWHVWHRERG